jgi:hypothetical protein
MLDILSDRYISIASGVGCEQVRIVIVLLSFVFCETEQTFCVSMILKE